MDRKILDWSFYVSFLSIAVPLIFTIVRFNRQPLTIKWLAITLLFSFLCDTTGRVLYYFGVSPNISSNTYILLSTSFISIFFYNAIGWKQLKSPLLIVNLVYLIFGLINLTYIQAITINSYTFIFQSVVIIVLSLIFFYKLLKELPAQQLQRMPLFWIVSGFFFSFSGKLVIYTATQYLVTYIKDNLTLVWSFHNFLSTIANLLIATGAWIKYKELTSPRPEITNS
jgi:hypothetical protein